ncbi:MAG: M10 family metallopeptidase C-terminal domain-containing protein, partial [Magnetococcales bacterium]|nr:M10 family metallopeptidase C-terminal domain-containing protein [Magnetococcales bacterium]
PVVDSGISQPPTTPTTGGNTTSNVSMLDAWLGGSNDLYYLQYSYSPGTANQSALWEQHRSASGSVTVDTLHQTFTYQEERASDAPVTSPFSGITKQLDGQITLDLGTLGVAHGAVAKTGSMGIFSSNLASYQTSTPNSLFGLIVPDGSGRTSATLAGEYRFAHMEESASGPVTSYGTVTLDGVGNGQAVDRSSSSGVPKTTLFTYSVQDNGQLLITESDGTVTQGKVSPDGEVFVLMDSQAMHDMTIGLRASQVVPGLNDLKGDYSFGDYTTYLYNSPDPTVIYNNWTSKNGIDVFDGAGTGFVDQRVGDNYMVAWDELTYSIDAQGWIHMNNQSRTSHDGVGFLSSDGNILIKVDTGLSANNTSDGSIGLEIALRQDTVGSLWQGEPNVNGMLVSDLIAKGAQSSAAASGIAVTDAADQAGIGSWQYTLDGGVNWSSFTHPSSVSAQFLAADAATRIRFLPNSDFTGDVSMQYHAWNGSGSFSNGQGGVDATASGFSTLEEKAVVAVHPKSNDSFQVGGLGTNSTLFGTPGSDLLLGSTGNDNLRGGSGGDTLVGGLGSDTFQYDAATDSQSANPDHIVDFGKGVGDKINFEPAMVGGSFNFIGDVAFHATGHTEARFDQTSSVLQVDLGGDGLTDMAIKLEGITLADLDPNDFSINHVNP